MSGPAFGLVLWWASLAAICGSVLWMRADVARDRWRSENARRLKRARRGR